MQHDGRAAPRDLPRGLAASESSADDMTGLLMIVPRSPEGGLSSKTARLLHETD